MLKNLLKYNIAVLFSQAIVSPSSGRDYTSIEVGGVKQVQFRVNLTNTGTNESAIVLMLTVEHSRTGVFSDQLTVVYVDSVSVRTLHVFTCILHFIFTYIHTHTCTYVSELRPLTVSML